MFDQCECKLIDTNMNLANSFSKKKYIPFSRNIYAPVILGIYFL